MTDRILILGSGAREAAIARALAKTGAELHLAPGNAGSRDRAEVHPEHGRNVTTALELGRRLDPALVIVGPEALLADGVVDALEAASLATLGPRREAARLETSKHFLRTIAERAGIPSPRYRALASTSEIDEAIHGFDQPPVVKASGLAAGKGVTVPDSFEAAARDARSLLDGRFGEAGRTVVLEERLRGEEVSAFFLCDGVHARFLGAARDAKARDEGDRGPNTGGMGAIAPHPLAVDEGDLAERFVAPLLRAMVSLGTPYRGVLYLGLIVASDGPRLLEVNVRFGDPEASVVLPALDPAELRATFDAAASGAFGDESSLGRDRLHRVAVVVARAEYPSPPSGEAPIVDTARAEPLDHAWVDFAGVSVDDAGRLRATGGRVATAVGEGDDLEAARRRAHAAASTIRFSGARYRRDLGKR